MYNNISYRKIRSKDISVTFSLIVCGFPQPLSYILHYLLFTNCFRRGVKGKDLTPEREPKTDRRNPFSYLQY